MVVQADEYERAQNRRLDDFFNSTENIFTHPEVRNKVLFTCTSRIMLHDILHLIYNFIIYELLYRLLPGTKKSETEEPRDLQIFKLKKVSVIYFYWLCMSKYL
jgi:hypothetical protein